MTTIQMYEKLLRAADPRADVEEFLLPEEGGHRVNLTLRRGHLRVRSEVVTVDAEGRDDGLLSAGRYVPLDQAEDCVQAEALRQMPSLLAFVIATSGKLRAV